MEAVLVRLLCVDCVEGVGFVLDVGLELVEDRFLGDDADDIGTGG